MKFISEVVLLFNLNFPKGGLFLFLSNHDILILLV